MILRHSRIGGQSLLRKIIGAIRYGKALELGDVG